MPQQELVLSEAAKIARTTPDALRGAINRNRLVARKIGPVWVVHEDDLYRYLESKTTWRWDGPRFNGRPRNDFDEGDPLAEFMYLINR